MRIIPAPSGACRSFDIKCRMDDNMTTLTVADIEALATRALEASNVSPSNAREVAASIAAAERDGQSIVGLSYLPTYCDHAACGKVDGHAVPTFEAAGTAAFRVDARTGFAHPALALGLRALGDAAREQGLAALAVGNSYACGSLGYFVERLAGRGLIAVMVANASPSIAPFGGKTPFFGTNPIAFAAPRLAGPPLVIDQSSSMVAKVAVIDAHRRGIPLPDGWALDAAGQPTNDSAAALTGSLQLAGGYKGFGLALLVEVLAGGLTASHFSFEASSFGDCAGGPPRTGQFVIAIDPVRFAGPSFTARIEAMLAAAKSEHGVRLPGDRRLAQRRAHESGIAIPTELIALVERYVARGSRPLQAAM
jgi:(2R)-3-sulfolactate dehydrogenase (NADP+)